MASADVTVGRAPASTALPGSRIRWGEQVVHVVLLRSRPRSRSLTTVGIVLSLLLPALEFFREVSPVDFFTGTTWAPLFEPTRSFGVLPLVVGTLDDLVLVGARRVPARARRRDLPQRVRAPARDAPS